jgi:hypothetical protein
MRLPPIDLIRRGAGVPLLLLISVVVFALLHAAASPSTPEPASVRDIERLRRSLGLDRRCRPVRVSLRGFLVGEWGFSFVDGRPPAVLERVPATLELRSPLTLALPGACRRRRGRGPAPPDGRPPLWRRPISLPGFWFASSCSWRSPSARVLPLDARHPRRWAR